MRPADAGVLPDLLRRFSQVARLEILRDHAAASCIASTWITTEVLSKLGYNVTPLEVRLSVGNAAYRQLRDAFGPPRTQAELDSWYQQSGAHVVGVGFERSQHGIGGHLIAVVGAYVVDASIDQVTDPANHISPPPVHWGRAHPAFLAKQRPLQRLDTEDLFIEYSHHPSGFDYASSYDWSDNPETSAAVSRIVNAIRDSDPL